MYIHISVTCGHQRQRRHHGKDKYVINKYMKWLDSSNGLNYKLIFPFNLYKLDSFFVVFFQQKKKSQNFNNNTGKSQKMRQLGLTLDCATPCTLLCHACMHASVSVSRHPISPELSIVYLMFTIYVCNLFRVLSDLYNGSEEAGSSPASR